MSVRSLPKVTLAALFISFSKLRRSVLSLAVVSTSAYSLSIIIDICREVTDSEYPELKAMINRNENIRFFASYIFKGNVRYDYLGEFPTLSIDQARNKARYLARSNEDETAYEYIPF